jgi:hypothetical protein
VGVNWGDKRLPERFWRKVAPCPMSGCWLWAASLNHKGYGWHHSSGKNHYGHRIAYEALMGPIPAGMQLDHLCRVRCCVNPLHLEPVTPAENTRRGGNASKTVCSEGHSYSDDNTYRYPDGRRACRICVNAWSKAWRRRKRGI